MVINADERVGVPDQRDRHHRAGRTRRPSSRSSTPTSIRLTFPPATGNANVEVTYDDGDAHGDRLRARRLPEPDHRRHTAGAPGHVDHRHLHRRSGRRAATRRSSPASTAGLGVHGNLNDLVDASDIAVVGRERGSTTAPGSRRRPSVPGSTGSFPAPPAPTSPIEDRNAGTGGTKIASQDADPASTSRSCSR